MQIKKTKNTKKSKKYAPCILALKLGFSLTLTFSLMLLSNVLAADPTTATATATATASKTQEDYPRDAYGKQRPLIVLPLKIYTLQFEGAPTLDAKTKGSEIATIVHELNQIYKQAGIAWKLMSSGPITIKHSKYYGDQDGFGITKDSQSIRYKLRKCIGGGPEHGVYRIYLLNEFPKGESEVGYYDLFLKCIFAAENTRAWGKTHTGLLAHDLGIALGLPKLAASNNMMFRRRSQSPKPEDNKLIETQILRARQIAEIELAAGIKYQEDLKEAKSSAAFKSSNPNNISNTESIFNQTKEGRP